MEAFRLMENSMKKFSMIDCGGIKTQTKGTWFGFVLEVSTPPNNKRVIV